MSIPEHTLLEAQQLSCLRGKNILFRNLSFSVSPGEILQIVGPNGSGKTSLLRILSGLLKAETGVVNCMVDKVYLGHRLALKPALTVAENLQFDLRYPKPDHQYLQVLLSNLGLNVNLNQPYAELSEGQRQCLALSRLLLSQAKLWILDEPFAALDAASRESWQKRMSDQANQGAVIFTSHMPMNWESVSIKTLVLPNEGFDH